ncbi:MAG: CBS domain-containing protein [Microcoleaceae cyanobacterium]
MKYQDSLTAQVIMSAPARVIGLNVTIAAAAQILLKYGEVGLSVVDQSGQLIGILLKRDVEIAIHYGFGHAFVVEHLSPLTQIITLETTLVEITNLFLNSQVTYVPVVEQGNVIGAVTSDNLLLALLQNQIDLQKNVADDSFNNFPENCEENLQENCGALRFANSTLQGDLKSQHRHSHVVENPGNQLNQGDSVQKINITAPNHDSVQTLLRKKLSPALLALIDQLAQAAEQRNWQLFLVGGGVRDLLLADSEEPLFLSDLDLVVDGYQRTLSISEPPDSTSESEPIAPAVVLAKTLLRNYPAARLEVHGQFQTAALLWENDPTLHSLGIDIATARTEFYAYPAANPEVERSAIRQDLYRRDFTVNALALQLTISQSGKLLDLFNGVEDLNTRQIRVIHPNSFIEDPTRIYRAVRFATRLGFQLEPRTRQFIHHAVQSGIYDQVKSKREIRKSQAKIQRTPALETRLRSELKYILQASYWQSALRMLEELDALKCIDLNLQLTHSLWLKIRLVDSYLQKFDPQKTLIHWQIRLETLISSLDVAARQTVCENLQLPLESAERLYKFETVSAEITDSLPQCQRPSQIVKQLKPHNLPLLTLVAAHSNSENRHKIRQYLTYWQGIKPPLNGNDLKQMGYQPGQQFKLILEAVLSASLDGIITNKESAKEFVLSHYPQLTKP